MKWIVLSVADFATLRSELEITEAQDLQSSELAVLVEGEAAEHVLIAPMGDDQEFLGSREGRPVLLFRREAFERLCSEVAELMENRPRLRFKTTIDQGISMEKIVHRDGLIEETIRLTKREEIG